MSFGEFYKFLKALARSKNLDLKLLKVALVSCGSPHYGKITVIARFYPLTVIPGFQLVSVYLWTLIKWSDYVGLQTEIVLHYVP